MKGVEKIKGFILIVLFQFISDTPCSSVKDVEDIQTHWYLDNANQFYFGIFFMTVELNFNFNFILVQ